MMLDKKQFIAFNKYMLMYLFVFIMVYVLTNATLTKSKYNIIALGASTLFIVLDYVAPHYTYNVGIKNQPLSFQ